MARVGINAIELNALEFMYCEEDISMVCWGTPLLFLSS